MRQVGGQAEAFVVAQRRWRGTSATDAIAQFDRPVLVVWASRDRVMPPQHARRLIELLPDASLVEIDDSYTLIPLDQPAALAAATRKFVAARAIPRRQVEDAISLASTTHVCNRERA